MWGAIKGWPAISQTVCAQNSVKMPSVGTFFMSTIVGTTRMDLIYSRMTTKGVETMKTRPSMSPIA